MSINNQGETPGQKIDNMTDGQDDPNRGPIDRAANALDGRDDPNRGPLARAENALGTGTSGSALGRAWSSGEGGVISAVFDSDDEARDAISALRSEGVNDASLSLITQRRGTTTTSNVEG